MPAYDYKCRKCLTVVEKFLPYPPPTEIPCEEKEPCDCSGLCDCDTDKCNGLCDYYPSFYYNSPAQRFKPTIIHRDAEGNLRYPGHADEVPPPGFHKVELTDFHQVRQFEREVERSQSETAAKWRETKQKFLDGQLKANREVMDRLSRDFTPRGRMFYDKMKEVSMAKQMAGAHAASPSFYIDAFSNDASNREAFYNEREESSFKRGRK